MKNQFILAAVVALTLMSCNTQHSSFADPLTGLKSTANHLKAENIFLSDEHDNKLGSNQIHLGSTIKIIAQGVSGITPENGRVYPGCAIFVTSKEGKQILSIEDAFKDISKGFDKDSATVLKATLTTGSPMIAGEKYRFQAIFFDKRDKEREIKAEIELDMQ